MPRGTGGSRNREETTFQLLGRVTFPASYDLRGMPSPASCLGRGKGTGAFCWVLTLWKASSYSVVTVSLNPHLPNKEIIPKEPCLLVTCQMQDRPPPPGKKESHVASKHLERHSAPLLIKITDFKSHNSKCGRRHGALELLCVCKPAQPLMQNVIASLIQSGNSRVKN